MPRLALILLVGLLSVELAGVFVPELCGPDEAAGASHSACPPMCVRCGCCRQPAVAAPSSNATSAIVRPEDFPASERRVPSVDPREILHVPKPLGSF